MYSVVTWEIDKAAGDSNAIQTAALHALRGRKICHLYAEVRIVRLRNQRLFGTDAETLDAALRAVVKRYPREFRYALWELRDRAPMRCCGFAYNKACTDEVRGV